MKTAREFAEYFASFPPEEQIALPTWWEKRTAVMLWNGEIGVYNDCAIDDLTDEQWANVIDRYLNADVYDSQAMYRSIADELEIEGVDDVIESM
jgi:hypothetical protein